MAEKLLMLALSPTMETGVIARWLKKEGDPVESGDILCEVETDKATMDYESPASGTLLKIVKADGSSASIGDLIGIVGKPGEDIAALLGESAAAAAPAAPAMAAPATPAEPAAPAAEAIPAIPAEPTTPAAEAIPAAPAAPVAATAATDKATGFIRSTPLARKIAEDKGLPLDAITGSGPEGRIVKADVEAALAAQPAATVQAVQTTPAAQAVAAAPPTPAAPAPPSAPAVPAVPAPGAQAAPAAPALAAQPAATVQAAPPATASASLVTGDAVIPVSGKRRIIAQRLSESMFSAPHYYLKVRVEMDGILAARTRINEGAEVKVSINALLVKFAAEALKRHPMVHATWATDAIIQHRRIDIGLAVAQPDGLITPVVRDCGSKGLLQIETELKELVQKARANTLKPEEYTGATFTISSLGSYGIEEFTAIINPPGSAILAVGEIRKEAVVQPDESLKVRQVMRLTLSCDHRVIDGAVGAAFLSDLRNMLEEPVRTLY